MTVHEAIDRACSEVGIKPPRSYRAGEWAKCDTLAGKSGKGDGRVIVDDRKATAFNWQTGETATIWLNGEQDLTPKDRRIVARQIEEEKAKKRARTDRAAKVARGIVEAAALSTHPYLASKGFKDEQALVIGADYLARHAGDYLVAGSKAIVMPARIGADVRSVQVIWEDGSKKFLAGGEITGSCHRIAKGRDTWLCEGFATGLSLRMALKSLGRSDTILCCFSASNVAAVSRSVHGRCYVVADHDKPMPQFEGLGTGEHWARETGKPYAVPPELGDINDMHMGRGIFAVQRFLSDFIRRSS